MSKSQPEPSVSERQNYEANGPPLHEAPDRGLTPARWVSYGSCASNSRKSERLPSKRRAIELERLVGSTENRQAVGDICAPPLAQARPDVVRVGVGRVPLVPQDRSIKESHGAWWSRSSPRHLCKMARRSEVVYAQASLGEVVPTDPGPRMSLGRGQMDCESRARRAP